MEPDKTIDVENPTEKETVYISEEEKTVTKDKPTSGRFAWNQDDDIFRMSRFLVVEYCYKDGSDYGEKHVLGAYPDGRQARKAAGEYIRDNVKKMKKKYRVWEIRVQKDRAFYKIGKHRRW